MLRRLRTRAFMLTELLVVLFVLAVLVSIMVPTLGHAKESAKRTYCKKNMQSLGEAYALYASQNRQDYPFFSNIGDSNVGFLSYTNWNWSVEPITGLARHINPYSGDGKGTAYNPTALLYMLANEGHSAKLFICPSTDDHEEPNVRPIEADPNMKFYDFSPYSIGSTNHCSYSALVPYCIDPNGALDNPVYREREGIDDSAVIVLADKTPNFMSGDASGAPWKDLDQKTFEQAIDTSNTQCNSPNHQGEVQNVLFVTGNTSQPKTSWCGYMKDNIYWASNDPGAVGIAAPSQPTNFIPRGRRFVNDTFLRGPKQQ